MMNFAQNTCDLESETRSSRDQIEAKFVLQTMPGVPKHLAKAFCGKMPVINFQKVWVVCSNYIRSDMIDISRSSR